ncbi:hypothetical protein [Streptomyces deserti]
MTNAAVAVSSVSAGGRHVGLGGDSARLAPGDTDASRDGIVRHLR